MKMMVHPTGGCQPQYVHDCGRCRYLGTARSPHTPYHGDELGPKRLFDYYVCVKPSGTLEFVARHGSDGPDYVASVGFRPSLGGTFYWVLRDLVTLGWVELQNEAGEVIDVTAGEKRNV